MLCGQAENITPSQRRYYLFEGACKEIKKTLRTSALTFAALCV
jgi:hypothetical protein